MAHFAYYNVGLSDARIKAHYEAGIRSGVVAGPGAYGGSAYGTVAYGGGTGAENTTPLVFTEASLSLTATGDLTASSAQFAMHDANLVFNAVATVGLDARPIHEARLVLHG